MEIIDVKKLKPKQTPHDIDAREIFSSKHLQLVSLMLKPGEKLLPHITPVDVVFYVLEGEGVLTIGNEEEKVSANQAVFSPKDISHKWENKSSENLRVLVMKTPKPTKKTKLL